MVQDFKRQISQSGDEITLPSPACGRGTEGKGRVLSHWYSPLGGQWMILLLAFLMGFSHAVFADGIDQNRMRRDLDIAEEALKRMLQYREKSDSEFSWNEANQVQGMYVDGYGVVFMVKMSRQVPKTMDKIHVVIKNDVGKTPKNVKVGSVSSGVRDNKDHVAEFLRLYGPTIGQLKDSDRIAVVVDNQFAIKNIRSVRLHTKDGMALRDEDAVAHDVKYNMSSDGHKMITETFVVGSSDSVPSPKAVRVRVVAPDSIKYDPDVFWHHRTNGEDRLISQSFALVKDITAYRRGQVTEDAFAGRMAYQTMSSDTLVLKKIDIMAGILDTALGLDKRERFLAQDQTTGSYVPNLGAIFFVKVETGDPVVWGRRGDEKDVDRVQDALIEAVADYGPTLRDLKADEYVTVQVNFEQPNRMFQVAVMAKHLDDDKTEPKVDFFKTLNDLPEMPGHLTLRVQKKYLDAYALGKLSLDDLMKKMDLIKM